MEVRTDILARNLRREYMSDEELRAQLRLQGVEDEADVADAYIEHDGRMSVIRMDGTGPGPEKARIRR